MTPFFRISSLTLAAAIALMASEPAPAVISKVTDKGEVTTSFETSFVTAESVDGIEFLVDDPKAGNKLSMKRGGYRVVYDQRKDIDFLRGQGAENDDAEKAIGYYAKAVAANRYDWVKEESLVAIARLNLAKKKYDDAIAAADQLMKEVPRSLRLDDILAIKGRAQQAKGDAAGAKVTFGTLAGMAKEWGDGAAALGAFGLASLLSDEKKPAEAAAALEPVLLRLTTAANSEQYGQVALALAGYQEAAGKTDQALATLAKTAYAPGPNAAEAQLRWARLLTDKGATVEAFDHAAIVITLKGAPDAAVAQARALVRTLVDKLQKDPGLTDQQKLEYRQCRDNL